MISFTQIKIKQCVKYAKAQYNQSLKALRLLQSDPATKKYDSKTKTYMFSTYTYSLGNKREGEDKHHQKKRINQRIDHTHKLNRPYDHTHAIIGVFDLFFPFNYPYHNIWFGSNPSNHTCLTKNSNLISRNI